MVETYTVSDQRAHTAMVMALSEAEAFEHFLKETVRHLREEADRIDAFLAGEVDGHSHPKPFSMRGHLPSREIRSWYEAIHKERDSAEAALRAKT